MVGEIGPFSQFQKYFTSSFFANFHAQKSTNVTCWYNLRKKKLLEDVGEINPWVYQTVYSKRARESFQNVLS